MKVDFEDPLLTQRVSKILFDLCKDLLIHVCGSSKSL